MSSSNRMTKSEQGISNQPFFLCICLGYWILLVGCWTRGQCLAIHSCFLWQKRQIEAPMASRIPRALPLCGANFRLPDLAGKCFGTIFHGRDAHATKNVPTHFPKNSPNPLSRSGSLKLIGKNGEESETQGDGDLFRPSEKPDGARDITDPLVSENNVQQPTRRRLRQKFGRLEIPCWILDIQSLEKSDEPAKSRGPTETRPRGTVHPTQCQPQSNAICLALRTESRHCVWLNA